MNYTLKELLDIPRLQELLGSLDELHSMPSAIIDTEGNVLTATAWQDICTKFHRVNSDTEKMCIESNRHIESRIGERQPHVLYKCPMGLVDSAMPIIIEGKHLGNVFTGQLFMEAPDEAYFINQARTYGFDEVEYLDAMRKVPFFPEENLLKNLNFIHGLAQMLAEQGLQNKRLQESQDKHRTILLTSTSGFWLTDIQGQILEVNDAYCQMSGYSEQELLTMHISDLEALERPEDTAERIQKMRENGKDLFESVHRRKDGSKFVVEVSTQYQPFGGGQCVAFLRDITEHKQGESLLKARISLSEYSLTHSLKELLTKTLDEIETLTKSRIAFFHFLDADQQTLKLQSWSSNTLSTMCHAEGGGEHYSIDKAGVWVDCVHMRKPVIHNDYATLPHRKGMPQGHATVLRELVVPIFRGDLIVGIIGVGNKPQDYAEKDIETVMTLGNLVWDIVGVKLAENALRDSEQRYRDLFANAGEGICALSTKGRLIEVNESFARMHGYCVEEMQQMWLKDLDTPETSRLVPERMSRIMAGETLTFEVEHYHKDGYIIPFEVTASLVSSGGESFIQSFHRDISERKKAEEEKQTLEQQLQHTQKLESLGVLSSGIAHDFNNILAIIIGYCNLTKMDIETAEKNIPIIETAAERAAGLCRQMMAYAGKAQLTKTKVNMVRKVDEIVGMLKSTLPQNAVIKTDLSAEIPIIEGDASQLRQVVMNLIINASEAIGREQGEVNVSLSKVKVIADKTYEDYLGKPIPSGDYVCLEVTDNGCGMDENTKWRIFEPFYTTKFTGRGLGMSAVLGIIKAHNGSLQLFSELGTGTTFKVYLPAPTKNSNGDQDQTASTPSTPWKGSGTILLVEDEDQVRNIAKELLEIFGFTVLEAVNGKEGLDFYQKNAAEIRLVLTDMGMPVMDGYELFHKLKRLNPELPIIASSGYGDVEVCERLGSDNIDGLVSKPYNPDKLREVLKGVVENRH